MLLKRIKDFDTNYLEAFDGNDIIGFKVYTQVSEEIVGSVKDILLDESGHFRYLVVDFGFLIFNKQVILPVGCCRIDNEQARVYLLGLNRKQAENFPEYNDRVVVDYDYEEQVRSAASLRSAAPYNRDTYNYDQEPSLYELNDRNHQILKLYQERLMKKRGNTDKAALIQQSKDETNSVETPVKKKEVVIKQPEQVNPAATVSASKKAIRSACLIFNPVAGKSDSEQDLATIKRLLQPKINLDIRMTTKEVDADQLAQEAVEQQAEMIIVSGGDGTISAAAEAIVGTSVPLGVISRGTANAFATALGIPSHIEAACETILDGKTRVVDAAYCNGKPMVLLAGIGFEAETVEHTDREAKDRFGMLAYVLAGVQELRNFKSFETRIETEEEVIALDAVAVTIANAAPPTSVLAQGSAEIVVDDGLLDVTLVAPANRLGAIAAAVGLLQSAFSGETTDRPDTGYLRARSVTVTTNPPQKVVLDGELVGYTPVKVECVPGGLTVFVPAVSEEKPNEKLENLPNLRVERK